MASRTEQRIYLEIANQDGRGGEDPDVAALKEALRLGYLRPSGRDYEVTAAGREFISRVDDEYARRHKK